MKEKASALHANYIIDGVRQQLTPAELLDGCLAEGGGAPEEGNGGTLVDETLDPSPSAARFDERRIMEYLSMTVAAAGRPRPFPLVFPGGFTRSRIAKALLDAIWMKGHFRLEDLVLRARWKWDSKAIGNMAAFYASAEAAADHLDALGIGLSEYSFHEGEGGCRVSFKAGTSGKAGDPDEDAGSDEETDVAYESQQPVLKKNRCCPSTLQPDGDSWIIYLPFDSCGYRLGGSLLEESLGQTGHTFPEIGDAGYFKDCYEIVREMVEDGVLLSGATVGDGGLLTALKRMCSDRTGASVDISGIMNACHEDKSVRVLFGEIPGVLIQIRDPDYDYIDAEFLLQDIAYYPIGHPVPESGEIEVKAGGSNGIAGILQALLGSQASEGED